MNLPRLYTYTAALLGATLLSQVALALPASAEEASNSMEAPHARPAAARPGTGMKPQMRMEGERREMHEGTSTEGMRRMRMGTSTENMGTSTLRERIGERLEMRKQEVEKKLEEKKMKVRSQFGTSALNQFKEVNERLGGTIEKLAEISSRIDTRIAKLKTQGVDLSTVDPLNSDAKQKLSDAQAKVNAISIPNIPTNASSTKAQINDALKGTREQVQAAEKALQAARDAFMKVVAAIQKQAGDKADLDSMTRPATSTSDR